MSNTIEVSNINTSNDSCTYLPYSVLGRSLQRTSEDTPQISKSKATNTTKDIGKPASQESSPDRAKVVYCYIASKLFLASDDSGIARGKAHDTDEVWTAINTGNDAFTVAFEENGKSVSQSE